MTQSAHLIANHIEIDGVLPANIGSEITLRRPVEYEIETIRNLLNASCGMQPYFYPHECKIVTKDDGQIAWDRTTDQEQWHYYLLSDDQGGAAVQGLESAPLLGTPSLELSLRILSRRTSPDSELALYGVGLAAAYVNERYHAYRFPDKREIVTVDEIKRAELLRASIAELDQSYEFIKTALTMLKDVQLVSEQSRLHVIGYFAIIECLITHKPRQAESLDSISHQFQGKLELLTNQIGINSFVKKYFGENKTPWKKLYGFRSELAHGKSVDFKKDFQQLISQKNVKSFMAELTRHILLYAVKHPQLFLDLKEC